MRRARMVLFKPRLDKAHTEEELVNQLADPKRFVFRISTWYLPTRGKSDSQISPIRNKRSVCLLLFCHFVEPQWPSPAFSSAAVKLAVTDPT